VLKLCLEFTQTQANKNRLEPNPRQSRRSIFVRNHCRSISPHFRQKSLAKRFQQRALVNITASVGEYRKRFYFVRLPSAADAISNLCDFRLLEKQMSRTMEIGLKLSIY
jgi:hypothetical protein